MSKLDAGKPSRRSVRLRDYDYRQSGAYFITINAYRRRTLFGHIEEGQLMPSKIGEIIRSCWERIPLHFPGVETDAFVLMPNHVHGVVVVGGAGEACLAPTGAVGARYRCLSGDTS